MVQIHLLWLLFVSYAVYAQTTKLQNVEPESCEKQSIETSEPQTERQVSSESQTTQTSEPQTERQYSIESQSVENSDSQSVEESSIIEKSSEINSITRNSEETSSESESENSSIYTGEDCTENETTEENNNVPICKQNEEYSNCTNTPCEIRNCSQLGYPISCTDMDQKYCIKGCICQKDYLRAQNGSCVPKIECDPPCGGDPNSITGCGVNCGCLCSNHNSTEPIFCPAVCDTNGCDCIEGYVFDTIIKKCVLPHQCTPTCKENEEINSCINSGCVPQNCSQLGYPVACLRLDPRFCRKGCTCVEGYLRSENGTCVLKENCNTPCGGDPNAVPGCGNNCGKRCSDIGKGPWSCPQICLLNGCDCKDGFRFDEKINKCVTPDKCTAPIPTCPANEEYSNCSNAICRAQDCSQKGLELPCAAVSHCNKGCVCKENHHRLVNGTCVPEDQCPTSCGGDPNALPGCGVNCGKRCSDIGKGPVACPLSCLLNGCDCKDGFRFDDITKKCVKPDKCTVQTTPTCPANETFSNCSNAICRAQDCSQKGIELPCAAVSHCNKGCVCKENHYRLSNGTCVPEDQCPTSCGGDPNALPGCGVNCGRRCSDIGKGPVACILICNLNGCDCKDGFRFDDVTKKCVTPDKCTVQTPPTCPANEEYSNCSNAVCRAQSCSQRGVAVPCAAVSHCSKGCVCKENHYRLVNGTCVPEDQCPTSCGGDPNAIPGCGINCGRRCSDIGKGPVSCIQVCNPNGCDCKPGLFLDDYTKKCVRPDKCSITSPRCKANEVFSTCVNAGCDRRNCSQLNQPQICIDVIQGACIQGCVCEKGYLRDAFGKCVLQNQCPENRCSTNEVWNTCASSFDPICSWGKIIRLDTIDITLCRQRCTCIPGYGRNVNGECISQANCQKCGAPNEFYSCGRHCDNICETLSIQNQTNCPIINIKCNEKCYCTKGHARDRNNICIPIPNCPGGETQPTCGPNEEYSNCVNGLCRPQNCTDKNLPIACPLLQEGACIKGCVCKDHFLKNSKGLCVPDNQCDVCPEGENYSNCPAKPCNAEYCPKSRNDPQACVSTKECTTPRCVCGFNQKRDRKTGKCIPISECPSFPCGPNEVYDSCPPVCPGQGCLDFLNNSTCPKFRIGIVVPCKPQCRCIDNHYRNPNGICIPKCECSNAVCGRNEEYSTCKNLLCGGQDCSNRWKKFKCPLVTEENCQAGCICKADYFKSNGICVPESECPSGETQPTCGQNEEYSNCVNGLCRPQNCTDKNLPIACPLLQEGACIKGCVCKENFLKNSKGLCVPDNQCDVCPEGENYSNCPAKPCDAEYCPKSRNDPQACVSTKECTTPRCVCGFNQKRDRKTGKCIPISECPPFPCGPNEVYDSCPPVCPGQGCLDFLNNSTCPKFKIGIVVPCKPQCRCIDNHYRNPDGICIPKCECSNAVCGRNEEYSTCKNTLCGGQECSTKGKNFHCPLVATENCQAGCICKKDYLKSDGICVPENECPKDNPDSGCDDDK